MTIIEWLDKNGREEVCAELTKMATDITGVPVTCFINEEIPDYNEIAFYFEFDDGSHLSPILIFEEEDCTELTTTRILKLVADVVYDEFCNDRYGDWSGKQRRFIDALNSWADN